MQEGEGAALRFFRRPPPAQAEQAALLRRTGFRRLAFGRQVVGKITVDEQVHLPLQRGPHPGAHPPFDIGVEGREQGVERPGRDVEVGYLLIARHAQHPHMARLADRLQRRQRRLRQLILARPVQHGQIEPAQPRGVQPLLDLPPQADRRKIASDAQADAGDDQTALDMAQRLARRPQQRRIGAVEMVGVDARLQPREDHLTHMRRAARRRLRPQA